MQWNSLFENLGLGYTGLCNHYKDARINVEKMKKKQYSIGVYERDLYYVPLVLLA